MHRRGRRTGGLPAACGVALLLACGEAPPAGPGAPPGPLDFTGVFDVEGFTLARRSEERRPIRGTVIVVQREAADPHVVTFSLETVLSTPEGPIEAEVFGSARGEVAHATLAGDAETQLLIGTVPGIDPSFPFIPARLGPKIRSSFRMEPDLESPAEAGFRIEIANEPAPGEAYEPTRTTLTAVRSADAGEAIPRRIPD